MVGSAHPSCESAGSAQLAARARLTPSTGLAALVAARRPGGSNRAAFPIWVAIDAYCIHAQTVQLLLVTDSHEDAAATDDMFHTRMHSQPVDLAALAVAVCCQAAFVSE